MEDVDVNDADNDDNGCCGFLVNNNSEASSQPPPFKTDGPHKSSFLTSFSIRYNSCGQAKLLLLVALLLLLLLLLFNNDIVGLVLELKRLLLLIALAPAPCRISLVVLWFLLSKAPDDQVDGEEDNCCEL